MSAAIVIPEFLTVTLGFAVFLLGARLNAQIEVLRRFNIPEPVTGGLLASLVVLAIYLVSGRAVEFEMASRDFFLVLFFAGIGLNARLSDLIAGGKPLMILLVLTLMTIIAQNLIGAAGAVMFGYPAQAGVLFGSASLIGGHGTAIAWAPDVAKATGLSGAAELGVAVATLGLVLAALVGGPVARLLITRNNLAPARPDEGATIGLPDQDIAPAAQIDHLSFMRVMLYLNLAIILGYFGSGLIEAAGLKLPLFVPCLIAGILIANIREAVRPNAPAVSRTPALALISEFSLGAFLAMSLMALQLWTIAELGLAIAVIMTAQTAFTVVFVLYVLFPLLGRGNGIVSFTQASLKNGEIKGFTLIWPAGDEDRRARVLTEMQSSFTRIDGVLDPAAGGDAQQSVDLMSGLQIRQPRMSRSGFYVDGTGAVLTTSDVVAECTRITLDHDYTAELISNDTANGLAILRPTTPLAPMAVAELSTSSPRLQSEVAVSGYSYEGILGAPTLTWGTLADVKNLDGNSGVARLDLAAQTGDAGGPVLDGSGAVFGMLLPQTIGSQQLPNGVSFAANAEAIRVVLTDAGLTATDRSADAATLTNSAMNRLVNGMTVLVSCWN